MLTLIFPKTELTSASIPVRWCVDKEGLANATLNGLTPFVLFKINYKFHPAAFKLFPLDQFSAYLDIHHPGDVMIAAFLVTAEYNSKAAIHRVLIDNTYDREYLQEFCTHRTTVHNHGKKKDVTVSVYDGSFEHKFEIDPSLFGSELPEWAKFFVNRYWYERNPKDECGQRRRIMLFPITTLPIVVVEAIGRWIWNFVFCVVAWMCLVGASPRYLLHPFQRLCSSDDFSRMPSVYSWVDSNPKIPEVFWLLLVPFTPVVYSISILVACTVANYTLLQALYAGPALLYIISALVMVIGCGLFFPIKAIRDYAPDMITDAYHAVVNKGWQLIDKLIDWMDARDAQDAHAERIRELLLCQDVDGECLPELKIKDKSITLIFADIKNKVCRPMRG